MAEVDASRIPTFRGRTRANLRQDKHEKEKQVGKCKQYVNTSWENDTKG